MTQPDACVVRITTSQGETLGTGFLISADRRVATCAHVTEGTQPYVAFPGGEPHPAQVVAVDAVHDVVVLRVEDNLPPGAEPARLGRSADSRYRGFRSRGYRPLGGMEGIPAEGKVLDAVSECPGYPGVRYRPLILQTQHVRGGMSGAPVYVPDLDLVVGMLTGYWDSLKAKTGFSDRDTALATPSEVIVALCPDLQLEDPLDSYRRRVLEESRLVNLAGVPLPHDREGQPIPLEVPLDRVYIRIQAMPEEQRREEREAERRVVEQRTGRGGLLRRLFGRKIPEARPRRPSPADVLAVLRTLGEYFYRRGEVYQAEERLEPVDPQAALKDRGRLIILGAPGAGKTTLLRYLARRAAEDPAGPVPVLVSLRDYAAQRGVGGQQTLLEFALGRASRGDAEQRRALEETAQVGQVLWLADALDEAHGWREETARQVADLPGCLVLTSRPVGYERTGLEGLSHFEVLPLAPQEAGKFIRDWFGLLAERRGEGEDWIETRAAWLKSQIADRPRIAPLTRNPLLLTFLVVLAGEEPACDLPAHRAELYRRYVEELLATWEVRRHSHEGVEGQPALRLGSLTGKEARAAALDGFTRLGWRLHLAYYGGQGAAPPVREELRVDLARALQPRWGLSEGEATVLAEAVLGFWEEAGLVDRWRLEGQEVLAFRHLTFQEYAAARALANLWEKDPQRAWRFMYPRLHHYAWQEVVLLLAGIVRDATPLVRRILKAGSGPYEWELNRDLHLAARVMGEGAAVEDQMVQQMVWRLGLLIAPWWTWARWAILGGLFLGGAALWALWLWGLPRWWIWGAEWIWGMMWLGMWTGILPNLRALLWLPARALVLEDERAAHIPSLGYLGARALEPLLRALEDRNQRVREAAMEALDRVRDAEEMEPLRQALENQNWWVRTTAAEKLGRIGDPRAIELLFRELQDRNWVKRWQAAIALTDISNPRAVEPLLRVLEDRNWLVRGWAAEALGRVGGSRAIEALCQALQDRNWLVRGQAVSALRDISDPRAVGLLLRVLEDRNWLVRGWAAAALGRIGDSRAIEPLCQALGDRNWPVRGLVIGALGDIGSHQAIGLLLRVLEDRNWLMRRAAADALGRISDPEAVEFFLRMLEDRRWRVREVAARGLGHTGDPRAIKPLMQMLEDKSESVWKAAAEALGRIGDPGAVALFLQLLEDKRRPVREAAVKGLEHMGDPREVEPLIQRLGDKSENVREAAAEALGRIGDFHAVDILLQTLGNGDISVERRAAAEVLVHLMEHITALPTVRRVAVALWWRLTDVRDVAQPAYEALGRAVARMTELEVAALPFQDPTLAPPSPFRLAIGDRQ